MHDNKKWLSHSHISLALDVDVLTVYYVSVIFLELRT